MTKRHFTYLLPAVLLLLSACAHDDIPALQEARQLTFTVTDGGYASVANAAQAGVPATRAVENGYATTFTTGDECGLYVVRGKETVYANVKLTAKTDADTGNLMWQTDGNTTLAGGLTDEKYYLYYPYQADMTDKTATLTGTTLTDADFFKPLIDDWQPGEDQNTYAKYTASDLMTAEGTATIGADNILSLTFSMTHRMALAVIDMPKTVYQFTNERMTGNDYAVSCEAAYTSAAKPLPVNDGTYRYLVNSSVTSAPAIKGNYSDGCIAFTVTPSGIAAGNYKTYKVDGAAEMPKSYTVSVGDYLLRDGSLLPKTTTLTEEQKANVAAIVFWTPAETDPAGRVTPASLTDDKIMAADFPRCTHGLAVAVKWTSKGVAWQDSCRSVAAFQNGRADLSPSTSQYKSVATGTGATDNSNYILGYQNTKVLKAYNAYCRANGETDCIVKPVDALESFTASNPAPKGSTGWFVPSPKELRILNIDETDDVLSRIIYGIGNRYIVQPYLENVGGNILWDKPTEASVSSSEYVDDSAYTFSFFHGGGNMIKFPKSEAHHVRAVCAF